MEVHYGLAMSLR